MTACKLEKTNTNVIKVEVIRRGYLGLTRSSLVNRSWVGYLAVGQEQEGEEASAVPGGYCTAPCQLADTAGRKEGTGLVRSNTASADGQRDK